MAEREDDVENITRVCISHVLLHVLRVLVLVLSR